MSEHRAIWRGSAVKVLRSDARTAVIITPCSYHLRVRAAELQELTRQMRARRDAKKF
jgi:3-deoxy-D-arabino-heptulosonate 7-phosphate (DAHP) synthase